MAFECLDMHLTTTAPTKLQKPLLLIRLFLSRVKCFFWGFCLFRDMLPPPALASSTAAAAAAAAAASAVLPLWLLLPQLLPAMMAWIDSREN